MTLPDNIQYILERVADGEGNLPEVIAEAKMVLEEQGDNNILPWMKNVPEHKDVDFKWWEEKKGDRVSIWMIHIQKLLIEHKKQNG